MEKALYSEMQKNLKAIFENGTLRDKRVYLFGHCEATITLADALAEYSIVPVAILDNSTVKHGIFYNDIPVVEPGYVITDHMSDSVVLIVTRFYEAMKQQLLKMGFSGTIIKLVDYNSFAEYSLDDAVIENKRARCIRGKNVLDQLREKYPGSFLVFCPFQALGDVYFCMSYLPYYLKQREINSFVVVVFTKACAKVVELFGGTAELLEHKDLDAAIQAAARYECADVFIAHQDRPYLVNLHRALYKKRIPLEDIYKAGVFGLDISTGPVCPSGWKEYSGSELDIAGKKAILSPYAKSVPPLLDSLWRDIVEDLIGKGYSVFTNVTGDEKPLNETAPISPDILEMKSAVEKADVFIGIRSGLCDIIRTANTQKIALYPDYYYCDTQWKAIEMYSIDGFKNIEVNKSFQWSSEIVGN